MSLGIQLFGEALQDVYETLVQCEETTIVEDLEKFINDLIQCTESLCIISCVIVAIILWYLFFSD